jgi:hypothetical protein
MVLLFSVEPVAAGTIIIIIAVEDASSIVVTSAAPVLLGFRFLEILICENNIA